MISTYGLRDITGANGAKAPKSRIHLDAAFFLWRAARDTCLSGYFVRVVKILSSCRWASPRSRVSRDTVFSVLTGYHDWGNSTQTFAFATLSRFEHYFLFATMRKISCLFKEKRHPLLSAVLLLCLIIDD